MRCGCAGRIRFLFQSPILLLPLEQKLFSQREPLGSVNPITCNLQEMFSLKVCKTSPQLDPKPSNSKPPSQPSMANWICSERPKATTVAWHWEKSAGTEDIGLPALYSAQLLALCRVKPLVLVQRFCKSACEYMILWNHVISQCKFCLQRWIFLLPASKVFEGKDV